MGAMIQWPTEESPSEVDDLHTQLEELLDFVYAAEANWDLDDLIDLRLGTLPEHRRDRTGKS